MHILEHKDLKIPKRKPDSKKGDNGRVLVIGGCDDYVGAPILAGLAALRCGADWVTVSAPEKVAWAINCYTPDLITKKMKGSNLSLSHLNELLELSEKHDVVLIGNGIGGKSVDLIREFVTMCKKPMVIDAEAFSIVSLKMCNNAILTPHRQEFNQLLKNSGIKSTSKLKTALRDNVLIIKGKIDEIITNDHFIENHTGNQGMSRAGTGDVLAGLCAGFYAQLKDPLEAAKCGVYFSGLAGDMLKKEKKGYSYLASELVHEIKRAMLLGK